MTSWQPYGRATVLLLLAFKLPIILGFIELVLLYDTRTGWMSLLIISQIDSKQLRPVFVHGLMMTSCSAISSHFCWLFFWFISNFLHIFTFFRHTHKKKSRWLSQKSGGWCFRIKCLDYFEYLNYDNKMLTLLETFQCEVVLLGKKTYFTLYHCFVYVYVTYIYLGICA